MTFRIRKLMVFLLCICIAGAVFATTEQVDRVNSTKPQWFWRGIYVGHEVDSGVVDSTANKLARMYAGTLGPYDFSYKAAGCDDSPATTVTGVRVNDVCVLGPHANIVGPGDAGDSTFSCYASAANALKVRHCSSGIPSNPPDAGFGYFVFSNQP